ncbi:MULTISPECIES: hypothetical protein [unclassified Bacillus cereus group]|uniref:hypothetical protein n=1 Tax=unclassified Bacillus cereus group TaxID=2750818 RepID=UPI0022E6654A|nr:MULTISPECIES: hypothetical protein [unclassified Bacillus cereus group]MDA2145824.1 hypothetical protein [Bacillus cereus group sp. Bc248]MDA2173674.1 hypothetical protein [Bacillus cereus group sp. Bc247]
MQRNLTFFLGIFLIISSILRAINLFVPNPIWLFCISVSACLFALVDFIMELELKKLITWVKWVDIGAILIFILPLALSNYSLNTEDILKTPTDFTTLLAFGLVITTIGKKNSNYLEKTVNEIKTKYFVEEDKKILNMDSNTTKQAMKDLALAEYNTVLRINKIIIELKKCDSIASYNQRIHDGWGLFHESFSYYAITQITPFYDFKLNELFMSFYSEIGNASECFSTLSNPDHTRKLAEIDFLNIEIEITQYAILPNHNTLSEGYDSIKKALKYWQELKNLASYHYETIGFKSELNEEIN